MTNPPASPAKRKAPAAKRSATKPAAAGRTVSATPTEPGLVDQVRAMASRLLDISSATVVAGRALQTASEVVRAVLPGGAEPAAWAKTGAAIRTMRETAGLTIAEVSAAIDLKDPSLIEALENGRMALSFELILRLAAVIGRNDPVGFVMRFTRSSNPDLWKSLEALGVGKFVLHSVRERELANIYRSNDAARDLGDEEFAEILGFTRAAFEMAMALQTRRGARRDSSLPDDEK